MLDLAGPTSFANKWTMNSSAAALLASGSSLKGICSCCERCTFFSSAECGTISVLSKGLAGLQTLQGMDGDL